MSSGSSRGRSSLFGAAFVVSEMAVVGVAVVLFAVMRNVAVSEEQLTMRTLIFLAVLFAVVIGVFAAHRWRLTMRWYRRGATPTSAEGAAAMQAPMVLTLVVAALWLLPVVFFAVTGRLVEVLAALLAGVFAAGVTFLLTEWWLRPAAARVIAEGVGVPHRVAVRTIAQWLSVSVPLAGVVVALSAMYLSNGMVQSDRDFAVVVLTASSLLVVILSVSALVFARREAKWVRALTAAVRDGETVVADDGTEVGALQTSVASLISDFQNARASRELLDQHVGRDVARQALSSGTQLGGQTRFVAVLFVDLVGSTTAVSTMRPAEVVAMLNKFFNIVVSVVDRHRGFVNKFVGDEALVIFGAPQFRADAATAALVAARELVDELADMPNIKVGVGVAAGTVLAGNIGSAERFEYTVIGDPVNEAARLTELAKKEAGSILASSYAVSFASEEEQVHWATGDLVTLRGRTKLTRLAWPRRGALADT
ncbi:adenylate/guanylate cyclase domain-containing protein [Hoyosella rhizosphaerae]|uniref:Adenylate cyclase n=1 Tax=Hoyosella rhizosphaerae TaxID=1755582 RepID=A0A916U6P7_9ACTN|nr:adenylate/guanylate cyclase domain-containing protein [Hoyosella rhizosphaerae]MBN4926209.1 adenylate/guanylate cyclase domain-containing protein [Hoyosella rhizosphaerae]GGC61224.1 putative adenylate cyclase [Hoyosella rhizosphaerae]